MSESCDFLFISHRWILPNGDVKLGSEDRLSDFLLERGFRIGLLEHPLTTVKVDYRIPTRSRLWLLKGRSRDMLCEFEVWPSASPWRWLREAGVSTTTAGRYLRSGFAVVAADPLCGLAALDMRERGLATSSIFYCLDYADRRTANPVLNAAYQHACGRNLRGSDLVLCVSKRMMERFGRWHPAGTYVFFPNTPSVSECPVVPVEKRNMNHLVLLGVGAGEMRHDVLLNALALAAKSNPDVKLDVIGGGGGDRALAEGARERGLAGAVATHGFMPRDEALKLTASCGAGVVVYDDRISWNYYRDSLKIREYAACGLPTICDGSTVTALEARDAGAAILADNPEDMAEAFHELMAGSGTCRRMSSCALKWAAANDKRAYCDEFLLRCQRSSPSPGISRPCADGETR